MGFEKKKYSEKIRTKLKKNNHHSDIHDKWAKINKGGKSRRIF